MNNFKLQEMNAGKYMGKRSPCTLLLRIEDGRDIIEKLRDPQTRSTECRIARWCRDPTLQYISRGNMEVLSLKKKNSCTSVHCILICMSWDAETTETSMNKCSGNEHVVYIHNGLFIHEVKEHPGIWNDINEIGGCYTT